MLAKLVSGIMSLEIETGHYIGTPREERLRKMCNCPFVEDEYHFLFSCIAYQAERSQFYLNYVHHVFEDFMLSPDLVKVAWMLQKDNIKYTSLYVETLYKKRRETLYKRS